MIGLKSGGLKASQIIPVDKFRPENIDSYESFCVFVSGIQTERLCFVDEKSLRGAELLNVKWRADPLTGEAPAHIVNPDFRNTYCVMGIYLVNQMKLQSFLYNIGEYVDGSRRILNSPLPLVRC